MLISWGESPPSVQTQTILHTFASLATCFGLLPEQYTKIGGHAHLVERFMQQHKPLKKAGICHSNLPIASRQVLSCGTAMQGTAAAEQHRGSGVYDIGICVQGR